MPLIFGKSIPYGPYTIHAYRHTSTTKGRQVLPVCSTYLTFEQKNSIPRLQDEDFSHHITYPPGCQDPRRTTLMFSLHCILQPLFWQHVIILLRGWRSWKGPESLFSPSTWIWRAKFLPVKRRLFIYAAIAKKLAGIWKPTLRDVWKFSEEASYLHGMVDKVHLTSATKMSIQKTSKNSWTEQRQQFNRQMTTPLKSLLVVFGICIFGNIPFLDILESLTVRFSLPGWSKYI